LIPDGSRLDALELHILGCPQCAERAEEIAQYVDAMKEAMMMTGLD
jgi:hypothetical protein